MYVRAHQGTFSSFYKDALTNEHEHVWNVVVAHMDNRGAHPTTETLHDVLGAACIRFKPCPLSRRGTVRSRKVSLARQATRGGMCLYKRE
jgi:hypothetical protein